MAEAKTAEELQQSLDLEQQKTALLTNRLNAQGSAKIPTVGQIKKKGDPIVLTRDEQMLIDLEKAINDGPEKMNAMMKEFENAIADGVDLVEALAENTLPCLRYIIAVETEIHKYVKRGKRKMRTQDGTGVKMQTIKPGKLRGFKKGLSRDQVKWAKSLLTLMGRNPDAPKWEERIPVLGLDRLDIRG